MDKTLKSPDAVFERMKAAFLKEPLIDYDQRIDLLNKMEQILIENDDEISEAICKDYGNRSIYETKIAEIGTSIMGIRHTRKSLKQWIKPQKDISRCCFLGPETVLCPNPKVLSAWSYHGTTLCS